MIFCVPTPLANPAQRWSTRCITLHRVAHATLMKVICAPESTKALMGEWLARQSMYSMVTRPNDSGLCSIAVSMFCSTLSLRMLSAICS